LGASEKRTEGRENKLALTISYHSAAQLVAGGGTEALHMIETEQRASEYMGVRSLTLAILAMQKKKKKKKIVRGITNLRSFQPFGCSPSRIPAVIRLHLHKAPADRVSGGRGREGKGGGKKEEKENEGERAKREGREHYPRKIPSALWVNPFFSAIRRIARRE